MGSHAPSAETRRAGPGKAAGNAALLARPVAVGPVRLRPWKPGKVQLDIRLPDGTNPRPVFAVADLAAACRLAGDLATAVESLRRGIAMEHPLAMEARLQGRPAPADSVGPLLADAGGRPWNLERIKAAWKAFRRELDRGNATLPEPRRTVLPEGFSARSGRACFATLASKGGADRALLKRYIGHAAGDILGHRYLALDVEDLGAVAMAFEAVSRSVPATIRD